METSKLCNLCLSPGSIKCDFCPLDENSDDHVASFCSPEHLMLHKDSGKFIYVIKNSQEYILLNEYSYNFI